jgi:hypothetical protein
VPEPPRSEPAMQTEEELGDPNDIERLSPEQVARLFEI